MFKDMFPEILSLWVEDWQTRWPIIGYFSWFGDILKSLWVCSRFCQDLRKRSRPFYQKCRAIWCRHCVGICFEDVGSDLVKISISTSFANIAALKYRHIIIESLLQNWFSIKRRWIVRKGSEHVTHPTNHTTENIYVYWKLNLFIYLWSWQYQYY